MTIDNGHGLNMNASISNKPTDYQAAAANG